MMKRAVIYARVSTDEQGQGYSLPTQLESCRKYAAERGYVVAEEFTDMHTGTEIERPGLNDLYRLVAKGGTDFSVFERAGVPGLNFAYAFNRTVYHTALDDVDSVDPRSLQHHGVYALTLARHFGNMALPLAPESGDGDAVYFSLPGPVLVRYPASWRFPLAALVGLLLIGVIAFGIGTVSVAFTSLIALFVSGEFRQVRERKRMSTTIQTMRGHALLCGYGRMGSLAADEMKRRGVSVVVVENDPSKEEALKESQLPYVIDDATDDEVLHKAGLMHAKALVAVLPHDADNVYVTVTAHTLRPDLSIIARAEATPD